MREAFTLRVERAPSGLWVATSPDIPGLMVAERDLVTLFEVTPRVMAMLEDAEREAASPCAPSSPAAGTTI